jgi:hypothetical protein
MAPGLRLRGPVRPTAGRGVKTFFTIWAAERYGCGMVAFVSLATVAAVLAAPLERVEPQVVATERQARAMVTILSGAPLRFSEIERERPLELRESRVRGADGSIETVRLVEFQ